MFARDPKSTQEERNLVLTRFQDNLRIENVDFMSIIQPLTKNICFLTLGRLVSELKVDPKRLKEDKNKFEEDKNQRSAQASRKKFPRSRKVTIRWPCRQMMRSPKALSVFGPATSKWQGK